MLWIVVLLLCCLETVESQKCNKSEIIKGGLGKNMSAHFPTNDPREEHEKYIPGQFGKKIIQNKIQIQNMTAEIKNRFDNMKRSSVEEIENGLTAKLFLTKDTILIQIGEQTNSRKYWIELNSNYFRSKDPPKPEDSYNTILQLECNSISTSIEDCHSMYIMWYKNGMRMTDLDPSLSQINVTVDGNVTNFNCVATEYYPCYHRLQTTKHYDVSNIEECDDFPEKKPETVKSEHGPIDVKLKPDKREITVNQGEDLKVTCTAKCRPKCDVTWRKDSQKLDDIHFIHFSDSIQNFGIHLKIENISSFDEGIYSCLVNNNYGVAEKNFTLKVTDTEKDVLLSNSAGITDMFVIVGVIAVVIVILVAVVVVVIMVIVLKKYQKKSDYSISYRKRREIKHEDIIYAELDLNAPNNGHIHGRKPEPEVFYSTIDFTKIAPPMPKNMEVDSDDED